jgi:hypothetical protein
MSADSRRPQVTAATLAVGAAVSTELGRDRGSSCGPRSFLAGSVPRHRAWRPIISPFRNTEPELASTFVRAARPCAPSISAELAVLDVSLILTDDSANILMRSDGSLPKPHLWTTGRTTTPPKLQTQPALPSCKTCRSRPLLPTGDDQ